MAIIKVDQPKMVKYYMNEFCKKKKVVTLLKKTKMKERAQKKKFDKKYKKKHDERLSFKMEENIRYFTANGKKETYEM